jgi:hypothetical protein
MAKTSLGSAIQVVGQDILATSTVPVHALGSYAETSDGRGFRYGRAVAATVPGKLYQCTPQDATNYSPAGGLGVSAAAIGATQVTLTTSVTIALNALAGGYLTVAITPGEGYTYRIASNTAVTAATGCVITLEDPLVVALTTASKVVMVPAPYGACVIMPTTITAAPAGVSVGIIPTASYGWFQTHGPVSVLNSGGTAIGLAITPGGAAGAVKTGATTLGDIGYCLNAGTTAEYHMVFLNID